MVSFLTDKRSSGVLAHITSLPSAFGIGDIGESSYRFIDFLERAGQRYWQFLPTVPTSLVFDSSPYMSSSAFAGSPLLISPSLLVESGLLPRSSLRTAPQFSPYTTDYRRVSSFKAKLLEQAYKNFCKRDHVDFQDFVNRTDWLHDYGLYMSAKKAHRGKPWYQWPKGLAEREQGALDTFTDRHRERILFHCFEQYIFFSQWSLLKDYADSKNIRLIGDIPIYIGLDSADVWVNQDIFELDRRTLTPRRVSGVPPDYFSVTGQRWGNPLYRWNSHDAGIKKSLLDWWSDRLRALFELVDVARIDHFRGFASYWAIPASEETAVNGKWLKGPGFTFFRKIQERLGPLNIIAEDLGDITEEVIKLRDQLDFPGMKVLQFAFDENRSNPFLPYNFNTPNCVVYTGTHDNDTTTGWFLSERFNDQQRKFIKRYANRDLLDGSSIHQDLIYLALSSAAALAIIPLQDLLGFGSDCRMNIPGEPEGNWRWRCGPEFLTDDIAEWLQEVTHRFGR